MDTPEGGTPPHPPLTQPPPPCTQPRRPVDKRARTQLPAEKSKAKLLRKASGQSGGQATWGQNQMMPGSSESSKLAGTNNASPDDSQDERDVTPTPPEKTRTGDACLGTEGDTPAHTESEYDDPYGVRNTSQTQDPVYAMGNEWSSIFGSGKDAEGQTDVRDQRRRPKSVLIARNEQTEEEGAHDDDDPFLPAQTRQEKPRGNKRQRLESPGTQDEQVADAPHAPPHAQPLPAHPAHLALAVPPPPPPAANGLAPAMPSHTPDGRADAGTQGQGHGDVLPPYVPPPPQANPGFQYQLAPQQFLSQLQQLQLHQLQPPQMQLQAHLQQQAQQHMMNAPAPAIMNALQLQLQPQQPLYPPGPEATQQGPRNFALLLDAARKYRREAALKLAKKWCITPEYADDIIGMAQGGGTLGSLAAFPSNSPLMMPHGGHANPYLMPTQMMPGTLGRGAHLAAMDPWAAREMAAREVPARNGMTPSNISNNPLDPPGYRPMGPNRGERGPYENQGLSSRVEERTRDPRPHQGATAALNEVRTEDDDHPQRMDIDGPQYEASNTGSGEPWDNYAEGAAEGAGSWGGAAQDDEQSDEDEETFAHAAGEKPPRTEAQYKRAMDGLGIMAMPAGGFPEIHFQSTFDLTRHISPQILADWMKRSPPEHRLLLIVFGEGGLNRAAASRLSSRMENIFEEFLGHSRFRLDPPMLMEHENAQKQDPALVWRLSNIEPLAKTFIVRQFGWSNGQTSFHAFGEEFPVPKLVTGLDGFTQKSGVDRDIRDAFLDEPFLATIENLLRKKNRSAIRVRELATAAVDALKIEIRHVIKGDDESPFTAYVYINIPGVDYKAWEEWKKNELDTLTEYFGDGRITLHRGDLCRGCHGTDHTWTHCRYGKDDLRGWNTRAADRNSAPVALTIPQQPKQAQGNWWDDDRGGRDGKRNDDRRARGQNNSRNEYGAGPSHGGHGNGGQGDGRGHRQSTNRSRSFVRPPAN